MNVLVYKFGGASVHDEAGFRNVARILKQHEGQSMMVVLSAMGKTTNALEKVVGDYFSGDAVSLVETFNQLLDYHRDVAASLFANHEHQVFQKLEDHFETLKNILRQQPLSSASGNGDNKAVSPSTQNQKNNTDSPPARDLENKTYSTDDPKLYDEMYDRIVAFGELFSTTILLHLLKDQGFPVRLFDAGDLIRTDSTFRDARVDWEKTQIAIQKRLFAYFQDQKGRIGLTQGFTGSDDRGRRTTLGREGSDYTAAILGYCMRVKEITIWKDVPGILTADPQWFSEPDKLESLSYREAIELAYYGAKVIHPKTIKPLENSGINLNIKCFSDPSLPGTLIHDLLQWEIGQPIFIRKSDQVLISISPHDFSFIDEESLGTIFNHLADFQVKAHVTQHSAITFSVCTDNQPRRLKPLISALRKQFKVRYNENLELFTIRHYTYEAIDFILQGRQPLLEQKSRTTVHLLLPVEKG